ncbi:MAG: phosphoribosylformylglycinamidine synthase II, partial [Methanocalculus sp.]|nr:phosphoribosylformylglycinamidine synthase II [Methanocalculus sp.]
TQIKPTPMLGMVGVGELITCNRPPAGATLVLVGTTEQALGGSILDCVTGCGGEAPSAGEVQIVTAIRDLVRKGELLAATDLSRAGLLKALTKIAPCSSVTIPGDPITTLFSESYARFLVAVSDPSVLSALPHAILGTVGGDALRIRSADGTITITPEDLAGYSGTIRHLMRAH